MSADAFRFTENDRTYENGFIVYDVGGKDCRYNAFEKKDSPKLRLHLPRSLGAVNVSVEFYFESCKRIYKRVELFWESLEDGRDIYTASLADFRVGLYFFRIVLTNESGKLFGFGKRDSIYFTSKTDGEMIQFSISDFEYKAPKNEYGGILYHIFVDRFHKSGSFPAHEGAVCNADFSSAIPEYPEYPGAPLKNNTFYGGTLRGITEKLDYLKSLGVTLVYLSPIFESMSNHKYDTADYMTVDPMLGGDAELKTLIEEAEKKEIGIILDGVFNHTGADSIYFNRYGRYPSLGAYQSKQSPYYSWYDFKSFPNEYTAWWGIEILPRINPDEKSLSEFFVGPNGVIKKYRSMGIRGFRLDVVDELSDNFVSKIKAALEDSNDNTPSILYGEVWEDASNKIAYEQRKRYFLGKELDGVMNYPIREGIISYLRNHETEKLRYALVEVQENTPRRILHMQMNLLGSHDTIRILTALGGDSPNGLSNDLLRLKRMSESQRAKAKKLLCMAYTVLATIPGIPSIFYADEAGLEGYADPFNRMPYPWGNVDEEIQEHYIKIGQIRRKNKVYSQGDFLLLHLDSELLAFSRSKGRYDYVTVVNNSQRSFTLKTSSKHLCLFDAKSRTEYILAPLSSVIIRISSETTLEFI